MAMKVYSDEKFIQKTFARCEEVYVSLDTPCMLWTGPTNQHGYVQTARKGGPGTNRHRLVYEAVNGIKLSPEQQVDHLCGHTGDKRSRRCMNPAHMRVTSARENSRCSTKTKLNPAKVREMRELYKTNNYTQAELGRRYGVVQSRVSKIVNRKVWDDID